LSIAGTMASLIGRVAIAAGVMVSPLLAVGAAVAQGADRWLVDGAGAFASLPAPGAEAGVEAATFACAAQRWSLSLSLAGLGGGRSDTTAILRVDGRTFDTRAVLDGRTMTIATPRDAIAPLKAGLRMSLTVDGVVGEMLGELTFPLRGSRVAIEAVEERCTLRDMSGYTPLTFTPYSSYMNLVRELRQKDIDAFALATASQPRLDAAMAEFGEGRRVLFTRICGSSWYFGASGCNVTGFAPEPVEPGGEGDDDAARPAWSVVYDTENVVLHIDPKSASEGWPDLVTLPVRSAGPGRVWRWTDGAYLFDRDLPDAAGDEPLPLRSGHD